MCFTGGCAEVSCQHLSPVSKGQIKGPGIANPLCFQLAPQNPFITVLLTSLVDTVVPSMILQYQQVSDPAEGRGPWRHQGAPLSLFLRVSGRLRESCSIQPLFLRKEKKKKRGGRWRGRREASRGGGGNGLATNCAITTFRKGKTTQFCFCTQYASRFCRQRGNSEAEQRGLRSQGRAAGG